MNELIELSKKEAAGEITKAQFLEQSNDILIQARIWMTDEQFLNIQRDVLVLHHLLAKELSGHGYLIPGNDPDKPN
jgi:hypothetical protein